MDVVKAFRVAAPVLRCGGGMFAQPCDSRRAIASVTKPDSAIRASSIIGIKFNSA